MTNLPKSASPSLTPATISKLPPKAVAAIDDLLAHFITGENKVCNFCGGNAMFDRAHSRGCIIGIFQEKLEAL